MARKKLDYSYINKNGKKYPEPLQHHMKYIQFMADSKITMILSGKNILQNS